MTDLADHPDANELTAAMARQLTDVIASMTRQLADPRDLAYETKRLTTSDRKTRT